MFNNYLNGFSSIETSIFTFIKLFMLFFILEIQYYLNAMSQFKKLLFVMNEKKYNKNKFKHPDTIQQTTLN